jgi:hypothetical protein
MASQSNQVDNQDKPPHTIYKRPKMAPKGISLWSLMVIIWHVIKNQKMIRINTNVKAYKNW